MWPGSSPLRSRERPRRTVATGSALPAILSAQPDASVEDIARAAGVSRQTVYAHFPSREGLLDTVIDRAAAEVTEAFDAAGSTRHRRPRR